MLEKCMLVKADKPNSCYTYFDMLCNLKTMEATALARALKCGTDELNCKTAFDLLYNAPTRFKSIMGYRELIYDKETKESVTILIE